MSHFAEVIDGVVQRVIVAEQDFIDSGAVGDPANWIQTSYNSRIRNMFAGIGFTYEKSRDIFYPPKPYPSWMLREIITDGLDENNNIVQIVARIDWGPPTPKPNDGDIYIWNEQELSWIKL